MPMTTLSALEETGGITERRNAGQVAVPTPLHVQLTMLFVQWYAAQSFPPNLAGRSFEETVTDDRELTHLTPRQREWLDAYAKLWNATV